MINQLTGLPLEGHELKRIAELAQEQLRLEKLVEVSEQALEKVKQTLNDHSFRVLPEAMKAIGLSSFTLDSGESITLVPVINAKLPDAKTDYKQRQEAFKWLRDNKHDGIIKSFVSLKFDRGSDNEKKRLLEFLKSSKLPFEEKDDVHWQTLRAFVKEMIEEGVNVPHDLFGVFIGARTKVEGK